MDEPVVPSGYPPGSAIGSEGCRALRHHSLPDSVSPKDLVWALTNSPSFWVEIHVLSDPQTVSSLGPILSDGYHLFSEANSQHGVFSPPRDNILMIENHNCCRPVGGDLPWLGSDTPNKYFSPFTPIIRRLACCG